MELANLAAFLAVADAGGFSAAAAALHLTQPAVSKRIAQLESELDARLFDRVGRQVLLTEAGQLLLPRARQLLGDANDARRALRGAPSRAPQRTAKNHRALCSLRKNR